jgi:hypothetical protein
MSFSKSVLLIWGVKKMTLYYNVNHPVPIVKVKNLLEGIKLFSLAKGGTFKSI